MNNIEPPLGSQLPLSEEDAWKSLPTPKIRNQPKEGVMGWAHAYAGFSYEFAYEAVKSLKVRDRDYLLDPFVGSGTSGLAAAQNNLRFYGVDLDPFSALITRAKLAVNADAAKVQNYLLVRPGKVRSEYNPSVSELFSNEDLLFASSVFDRLIATSNYSPTELWKRMLNDPKGQYDSEAVAIGCIAISSRAVAKMVRGSNPVWLRKLEEGEVSDHPRLRDVTQEFSEKMLDDLSTYPAGKRGAGPRVANKEFQKSGLRKQLFDCVLTSPPYLNRLDYIVNHMPEISILSGFISTDIEALRVRMMGTTKMQPTFEPHDSWGDVCLDFLSAVKQHPSKASASYYHKFFCQYFDDLRLVVHELRRVCKRNARGLLVVQDSYYKDIRIPIMDIIRQMGANVGISVSESRTENVTGHMGQMSPTQTSYVPGKTLREHVLLLDFL